MTLTRFLPPHHDLNKSYDTVIVGGGVHGLSVAYRLALRGERNIAVLDAAYLGSGASGRNHTVVRAGFGTPEWIRLHSHSKRLWDQLTVELDYNVMLTNRGHVICIRDPHVTARARTTVETHHRFGIPTELVRGDRLNDIIPGVNTALFDSGIYDPSACISRHDAVVWGLARAASRLGVHIHSHCPAEQLIVHGDTVTGVRARNQDISAGRVVLTSGAATSAFAAHAGVRIPTRTLLIESFVTEPHKAWLDPEVTFLEDQAYLHQTSRGEFVGGAELPNAEHHDNLVITYDGLRHAARKMIELVPSLAKVHILRLWSGLVDVSPDGAGLVGAVDTLDRLYVSCGWGGYGYMASIGVGDLLADYLTTGTMPDTLRPFAMSRISDRKLIPDSLVVVDHAGEAASTATSA